MMCIHTVAFQTTILEARLGCDRDGTTCVADLQIPGDTEDRKAKAQQGVDSSLRET